MTPDRLTPDEALALLRDGGTADLMSLADAARRARHGRRTYFVHSLNVNPTNVCENQCELCAFWRAEGDADAYVLTLDEARQRIEQARGWGLTDLHVVGGVTDDVNLDYYEALIRTAKELLPSVLVQGMTAVEIHALAERAGVSVAETLQRLKDAGMGSLSGGGAEILADDVRRRICSQKISAEQWLAVHEQAHAMDLPTNATMLFGHVERDEDIIDHLTRLRDLQDRTGGLQAFIPLPFHPTGTKLPVQRGPGGHRIARVVAVARLFLDNVPHIRLLANYVDRKLLGVLTHAGVDDVGGTSLAERIAAAAGAADRRRFGSTDEMLTFLEDLDLEPVLTNSIYAPPAAPAPAIAPTLPPSAADALACAEAGERLSATQAVILHEHVPFHLLGRAAHRRRLAATDPAMSTFVLDRNISVTNVCEAGCRFCAFHVDPGSSDAFTLSIEEILEKVEQTVALGGTQVLLQGGLNPQLDLAFYERVLSTLKERTGVWLHSLSPTEVEYLARGANLSIEDTLKLLRDAGLDSLPGGGAEILVDAVRREVSPRKISADGWFEVMETAHGLGMKTTATMVYGLGETPAQRVEHLMRVRDLQDRTGGFTAFIPWSFQPNRTRLSLRPQTGVDYLRVVALARLVLDNVPHLQAGWVTEGPDVAQLALSFGADDFGGVLMEERVVKATGVAYAVTADDVIALIRETGRTPAQRTTQYEILHVID